MLLPALMLVTIAAAPVEHPTKLHIAHCLVSAIGDVDVAAKEAGEILAFEVHEGMTVAAGDLLATIDDDIPLHQREITRLEQAAAAAKAENDVAVRHARSSAEVAKTEYDDAVQVNKRGPGTLSQSEVRRRKLQYETAVLQIEQAEFDQQVNGIVSKGKAAEVAAADASIARRQVRSPLAGIVAELPKQAGEWVQPGDRMVQIVRLDQLRVEGFVRADEYDPDELDHRPVVVQVRLAHGRIEEFRGKVTFVHPQTEADGEYRVWAVVANRKPERNWLLRPGTQVEMEIDLAGEVRADVAADDQP
ncbi:MAG: efflux RND transporter periplasmic adaptor subunit [Pirellulales bacterium]